MLLPKVVLFLLVFCFSPFIAYKTFSHENWRLDAHHWPHIFQLFKIKEHKTSIHTYEHKTICTFYFFSWDKHSDYANKNFSCREVSIFFILSKIFCSCLFESAFNDDFQGCHVPSAICSVLYSIVSSINTVVAKWARMVSNDFYMNLLSKLRGDCTLWFLPVAGSLSGMSWPVSIMKWR